MTTTPTSGAATQRYKIGYHADEWGQRSSTPSGIPDASGSWVRYEDHVTALAAGQATAAQQGAYAALSESFLEIPDVQDESGINAYYSREVVLECIDAALASHGQAPAGATEMENLQRTAVGWQERALRAERNWVVCRRWAIAGGAPVEKLGDDPDQPFHAASPTIEGESNV